MHGLHLRTMKIKIWTKMVPISHSCQIYLKIGTLVNLKTLSTNLILIFKISYLKSIFGEIDPKFKLHQIYLKICTQAILGALNRMQI